MIEVRVHAICDWCGVLTPVEVNNGYSAVTEWEPVVGELDERPTSLAEAIGKLGLTSDLQILCPKCSEHVSWNEDLKLSAIDAIDTTLQSVRARASDRGKTPS